MAELSKAIARLMEERERAHVQPQTTSADPPKLREVLDRIRRVLPPADRPLGDALARQLFEHAAPEMLDEDEPHVLARFTLAAFQFLAERGNDEPRVRVSDSERVHGTGEAPASAVQTLMRDRPFIINTIRDCLREAGVAVHQLIHPILAVERDPTGRVLAIGPPSGLGHRESFVHLEVDHVTDSTGLANTLTERLGDVMLVVDDYQEMRARAESAATALRNRRLPRPWNADAEEIAAFLDWLGQKSFVFLGYREYTLDNEAGQRVAMVRPGSGLGILRKEDRSAYAQPRVLPEAVRRRMNEPPLLMISKTNAKSPIHRRAHMDYIGLKDVDASGVVIGERRFFGLFTQKAYGEESASVPLLRQKLAAILATEGALAGSHDYKAIVDTFNSIPRGELLAASAEELHREIQTVLAATLSSDLEVLCRPDGSGHGVFVVVLVPRDRFSNDLFQRIQARLQKALAASAMLEARLDMDDPDKVRMHFYLAATPESIQQVDLHDLRRQMSSLLQTWDDRLIEELRENFPRDQVRTLGERYTATFSNQYKAATDVAAAVADIRCLEAVLATHEMQVDVVNAAAPGDQRFTELKLYLAGEELILSDFLPVLENLGLRVFDEDPIDVDLAGLGRVRIHTFFVQESAGARLDAEREAPLLKSALLMLHGGRIESDRLNTLILRAGLEWRQVDVLRTYVNHGLQLRIAPSRRMLVDAVANHPDVARILWEYFAAKFDPFEPLPARDREARVLGAIEQRLLAAVDAVESVVDDGILRALLAAMGATVRTSFFCKRQDGDPGDGAGNATIAIKIESQRLPHLPAPQPLHEIYVHGPQVEGIHMRSAKIARGGIRLSDRPDDFRTEVLGLMKTQMVKNAVIVPAGAKGGFVVKTRGDAPSQAQVVAAYRTFIAALLGLTDNFVQGRLVQRADVLSHDEPDTYLVVAADKGTASFSDVANEIAAAHQFWLGDAFASGGQHGYDHKKQRITARGAWECVRRHFREMGRDAEREVITVIGIGDMSGDVFGNGMLLSRRFCLRATFNHQHIFLDPDPDLARAFAERERLSRLPRSSWADYNPNAIGGGGGVFQRHAKKIPLSAPVRNMLRLDAEHATGDQVVRAILCMDADLLWNGGIGTYVKASGESHAAVGDASNDTVRVDATQLGVKVVAEGGNLGFTQRGRIEYALHGGRINTDAIDNSAGVDMSDHEVNIKIALAGALEGTQLGARERDDVLAGMTGEVTHAVLSHNARQARALSFDQVRSRTRLIDFRDLMTQLESAGLLDRQLECLPDREVLRGRRSQMLGLARPELAVILAHSKLSLQQQLLASAVPDDPFFERFLRAYFPEVVNTRFRQGVRAHRLRREIITVEVANALIDTMGTAFVTRVARDTGCDAVAIVRAWTVAVSVSGAANLWAEIEGADPPLPLAAEEQAWLAIEAAVEGATKWIVETQPGDVAIAELVDLLTPPIDELLTLLPEVLSAAAHAQLGAALEALIAAGAPRALAERALPLERIAELCEIAYLAGDLGVSRRRAAEVYYGVGEEVELDWVRARIDQLPAEDRWEQRAIEGMRETLVYTRRKLAHDVLECGHPGGIAECLEEIGRTHQTQLSRLRALIDDVRSGRRVTLAALLVVIRELGRMASDRL